MTGRFVPSIEATREQLDWGVLGWLSRPPDTGAEQVEVVAQMTMLELFFWGETCGSLTN